MKFYVKMKIILSAQSESGVHIIPGVAVKEIKFDVIPTLRIVSL